jgi:hypothetical protein
VNEQKCDDCGKAVDNGWPMLPVGSPLSGTAKSVCVPCLLERYQRSERRIRQIEEHILDFSIRPERIIAEH